MRQLLDGLGCDLGGRFFRGVDALACDAIFATEQSSCTAIPCSSITQDSSATARPHIQHVMGTLETDAITQPPNRRGSTPHSKTTIRKCYTSRRRLYVCRRTFPTLRSPFVKFKAVGQNSAATLPEWSAKRVGWKFLIVSMLLVNELGCANLIYLIAILADRE